MAIIELHTHRKNILFPTRFFIVGIRLFKDMTALREKFTSKLEIAKDLKAVRQAVDLVILCC
ncbi:MAG: hypothetical protein JWQ09_1338 [Segetibacter sp.]|nr:hypothetical protein [Segetibacter sp.]